MDKNVQLFMDKRIDRTKDSLIKNNYDVYVVEDAKEAREKIKEIIEDNAVVSFGGSMTIIDAGIIDTLRKLNIKLLDRYKEGLAKDDIGKLYRESFFADYYISSCNALTENGEIVNLDGNGNRAAALIFGPRKVIIVAGVNKIVNDIDEAYDRVRNYAAPINSIRLSKKTPCVETGMCMDCSSKDRICNHLVITYRQNTIGRGVVILVKQELGY